MSRVDVFTSKETENKFLSDLKKRSVCSSRNLVASPYPKNWGLTFSVNLQPEFCVPGEFLDINQSTEEK